MKSKLYKILVLISLCAMSACGYNDMQAGDEEVKASWAEVVNQFQRRADLVPNLVNIVKGYAAHEKEVLETVTAARAKVGSISVSENMLNNKEEFEKFAAAQAEMKSALSRLLVVSENYPQLKADGVFRDLQAQLEGTENRITVARNRYIKAVQQYNVLIRSFPTNLTAKYFDYTVKPTFSVENEKEIAKAPEVKF